MNVAGISTEEVPVQTKKITITISEDPSRVIESFKVTIPVLTCLLCKTKGDCVPNTLNRPTYDRPWSLQGFLFPKGWEDGKCATCVRLVKATETPAEPSVTSTTPPTSTPEPPVRGR